MVYKIDTKLLLTFQRIGSISVSCTEGNSHELRTAHRKASSPEASNVRRLLLPQTSVKEKSQSTLFLIKCNIMLIAHLQNCCNVIYSAERSMPSGSDNCYEPAFQYSRTTLLHVAHRMILFTVDIPLCVE